VERIEEIIYWIDSLGLKIKVRVFHTVALGIQFIIKPPAPLISAVSTHYPISVLSPLPRLVWQRT
jgi:hypothetical protein